MKPKGFEKVGSRYQCAGKEGGCRGQERFQSLNNYIIVRKEGQLMETILYIRHTKPDRLL